ncbi:hypothetical protein B1218_36050 [Pseudomonas ogarae]|nr:hypothetical protein B1218_36050 [Pseudomonas ogarae]
MVVAWMRGVVRQTVYSSGVGGRRAGAAQRRGGRGGGWGEGRGGVGAGGGGGGEVVFLVVVCGVRVEAREVGGADGGTKERRDRGGPDQALPEAG